MRQKASTFWKRVSSLERTLFFLKCRAAGGDEVAALLSDTKAELAELHRQQAQGCRVRSKVQWAEEGESSSAYFFNLEKRRSQLYLFSAIKTLTGQIVSSLTLIARAWVSFYARLFSAEALDSSKQDFFLQHISCHLSASERDLCDGPLTFDECKVALDAMAPGKSPGLDGFPAEFYQRFWP